MNTAERVLERLDHVRRSGPGWVARCPSHRDRQPSLSIDLGDDDRVLLHCHRGCSFGDVVAAIGLEPRDLFPDREEDAPRLPSAEVRRRDRLRRQQREVEHLRAERSRLERLLADALLLACIGSDVDPLDVLAALESDAAHDGRMHAFLGPTRDGARSAA